MKYIQDYVIDICDELNSAKEYGEKAIYWKSSNNINRYKVYLQMATEELQHSKNLHDMVVEEITRLKEQGFTAPEKMQKMWEETHAEYVEKYAWVKKILEL